MEPILEIIASSPPIEIRQAIEAALDAFNIDAAGIADADPDFAVALRDPETNGVCGGLYGVGDYGWAFIKLVVVPAEYRGRGLGTKLLAEAEAIAKARGYAGVWLDTFEFQARPFYEKLGYTLFGELEGDGNAIARYFMKKKF